MPRTFESIRSWYWRVLAAVSIIACDAPRQPRPEASFASSPAPPVATPASAPAPPAVPAKTSPPVPSGPPPSPSATVAPSANASSLQSYPLAAIRPPYPQSAHPGDGQWSRLGRAGDRAATGNGVLYVTTLHPHATSRFVALTIVSIDLDAARLGFVPGTEDVGTAKLPEPPGLVPAAERDASLAAFNGGFQPRHGRWGMRSGGVTIVPPRPNGCTIALTKDGRVSIRPFESLAGDLSGLAALRQTPPCLLDRGSVHPDLLAGRDKIWGGRVKDVVTRRRSALGIDASGRFLFYAIGIETSPRLLAEGLKFAGADSAAELDVNWNWTRFMLFGLNEAGELRVTSALVEAEFSKLDYIERASQRDFFYVARR